MKCRILAVSILLYTLASYSARGKKCLWRTGQLASSVFQETLNKRRNPMPLHPNKDAPYTHCSIWSSLADTESAYQKYGHAEGNTYLPAAANSLQVVKDFKPYGSRKLQLQQCPQCATYYLYRTDYE